MRIKIVMILCILSYTAFAQKSDDSSTHISKAIKDFRTPYNPKGDYHTWGVKATLLPIPYTDQTMVVSALGIEYGFTKNQSLGLDTHLDYSFGSHNNVLDTLGIYHSTGKDFHTTDMAAILNYRYYFNMEKYREENGLYFYTGAYLKYGKVLYYQNQLYQADYISKEENDYSEGVLVGALLKLSSIKNIGIDANFGLAHLETDVTTVYKDNGNVFTKIEKPTSVIPRFGLYFYWWFYR